VRRLRPIQFFQPFSQLKPAGQASYTVLAVWAMDSEAEQYVADPRSQHHSTPGDSRFEPLAQCGFPPGLSLIFRKEEVFCSLGPTTFSVLLWAYGATLSKALGVTSKAVNGGQFKPTSITALETLFFMGKSRLRAA
jgi:hypothetical protein